MLGTCGPSSEYRDALKMPAGVLVGVIVHCALSKEVRHVVAAVGWPILMGSSTGHRCPTGG